MSTPSARFTTSHPDGVDTSHYLRGTVAMVTAANAKIPWRAIWNGRLWVGGDLTVDRPTSVRVLLVLDPEQDVQRIADALRPRTTSTVGESLSWEEIAGYMLNQLAKPPRIPEPGDLGAVRAHRVGEIDTDLRKPPTWVRLAAPMSDLPWVSSAGMHATWDELVDPELVRPGMGDE